MLTGHARGKSDTGGGAAAAEGGRASLRHQFENVFHPCRAKCKLNRFAWTQTNMVSFRFSLRRLFGGDEHYSGEIGACCCGALSDAHGPEQRDTAGTWICLNGSIIFTKSTWGRKFTAVVCTEWCVYALLEETCYSHLESWRSWWKLMEYRSTVLVARTREWIE